MPKCYLRCAMFSALLFFTVGQVSGQILTPNLSSMPSDDGAARFFPGVFSIKHPSLTLNGFIAGADSSKGYGLKEVLQKVYARKPEFLVSYQALISLSLDDAGFHVLPGSYGHIVENARRIQARAFVALVTYVLERNGNNMAALNAATDPDLPSHAVALQRFKQAVTPHYGAWQANEDFNTDAMKWAEVNMNNAMALDFYLALERAYLHFQPSIYNEKGQLSHGLLSCGEKRVYLNRLELSVKEQEHLGSEWAPYFSEPIHGVDGYDWAVGNWSLKTQTAIGLASLTQQSFRVQVSGCPGVGDTSPNPWEDANYQESAPGYAGWVSRAFRSLGAPGADDRHRHWMYQTGGGRRFWAEGAYYFQIALEQVIPFWHAARVNNLLSNTGVVSYALDGDPFYRPWFIEPLRWLADIATPDGRTPPLEDGNKWPIFASSVLRWRSDYGEGGLGLKFAWINNRSESGLGYGSQGNLLALELAIPRTLDTSYPLPSDVGRYGVGQPTEDEQQVVIRRSDNQGRTHYVLVNGEHGRAISHGEGHEHPDQMQLLYYVDGQSYLIDSGYNSAQTGLSTWNHYRDHNVMTGYYAEDVQGGASPPWFDPGVMHMRSDHQQVKHLYRRSFGKVDIIDAEIDLHGGYPGEIRDFADYRRSVLFVGSSSEYGLSNVKPYLIDFNSANKNPGSAGIFPFVTHYHTASDNASTQPTSTGSAVIWSGLRDSYLQATSHHLVAFPFRVDLPQRQSLILDAEREVNAGAYEGRPIRRLEVPSGPENQSAQFAHTTVAFVQARPNESVLTVGPTPREVIGHRPGEENVANAVDAYVWAHTADVVDVLVARSAFTYLATGLRNAFPVQVAEAGNVTVTLPSQHDYGFVRLTRYNGVWAAHPDYLVNLTAPPRPLAAAILGPTYLPNYNGTWTASVSGGQTAYSYLWEYQLECGGGARAASGTEASGTAAVSGSTKRKRGSGGGGGIGTDDVNCDDWYHGGTGPAFSRTFWQNATLRLTVGDALGASLADYKYLSVPGGGGGGAQATPEDDVALTAGTPTVFALRPNQPNPFGSATTIRYDLPEAVPVTLAVYDVTGREVARLVDGEQGPGYHSATFDGRALPSGVYVYRLRAGSFTETRRMVLLK